jgi:hypothetical protein
MLRVARDPSGQIADVAGVALLPDSLALVV